MWVVEKVWSGKDINEGKRVKAMAVSVIAVKDSHFGTRARISDTIFGEREKKKRERKYHFKRYKL